MQPDAVKEETSTTATSSFITSLSLGKVFFVVILLSVDDLNPVKVFCSYATYWGFTSVTEARVAPAAFLLLLATAGRHWGSLMYYVAKMLFRCLFHAIFFRSIEVVGLDNLPKDGPCILTGNHNNQFVDGIMLMVNCRRHICFMIAESSFNTIFVGFVARLFQCIPVVRADDLKALGMGVVVPDGSTTLLGRGTQFDTEVGPGSSIQIKRHAVPYKVAKVVSATELVLASPVLVGNEGEEFSYFVIPQVDQSQAYAAVYQALRKGLCLGIFPEGGSHDRTDLLPLKAGVAIIALNARSKHHISVPIVPVGLNYFQGHRFRGRVVVEFGTPISVSQELCARFELDRRWATDTLLQEVASGMRSVIIPTADYRLLQQIYLIRRLWTPDGLKKTPKQIQDLNRRFAVGVQRILCKAQAQLGQCHGDAAPPPDDGAGDVVDFTLTSQELDFIQNFKAEFEDYAAALKRLRIRDHQIRQIGWWTMADLIGGLLYAGMATALGIIPNVLFIFPVASMASWLAVRYQAKALKKSTVKLAARDVVLSMKIIYCICLMPVPYFFYGMLLIRFTSWCWTSIVLTLASVPFIALMGVTVIEQGVRAFSDLLPLFQRTLPSHRAEQDALPARRARVQKLLHQMVRTFGPRLGNVYQKKSVDWKREMGHFSASASNLLTVAREEYASRPVSRDISRRTWLSDD